MCGIAGAVSIDGRAVDPGRIEKMAAALAHRGPDGEGLVFFLGDGAPIRTGAGRPRPAALQGAIAALAHRRLNIIDLSERASQPMAADEGRCWITYNGELYNYLELRAELESAGQTFHSQSDTEVVLRAYLEWGADCLARFNGMFAFAVWDSRRRRLFCARDRLGIKPFYYRLHRGLLLFASEPKAILAGARERPAPNVAAMEDYLTFSYVPSLETMFEGIHRLAPGSWMVADRSAIRQGSYWQPVFDPAPAAPREERIEELRGLLQDSLRLQVRSDVPIGCHLSGGIDSSAVSCLASRHVSPLRTFTARFAEGGFFDETPYARLVASAIGSEHHEITPRGADLAELLPKIIYHLDEPVESASVFGKYHVAEIVSRSVKVVLGGQGGDELFGGYDWYVKSLFTAASFGAQAALGGLRRDRFLWHALTRESPRRLAKSLWKNLGDANVASVFCRNWSRFTRPVLKKVFRPEVLNGGPTSEDRFLRAYEELPEARDGDRMFKFDMRYYLEALLTSEDRLSMAFSVESRVPLLDHRIAELAGRLGFEAKSEPGRSKQILREAVGGIVPPEILARRDKRGFPTPVGAWLRDRRLDLMGSLVFSGNAFAREYFDLRYLKRLMSRPALGSTDWSERMWRILNLSVWGRVFNLA